MKKEGDKLKLKLYENYGEIIAIITNFENVTQKENDKYNLFIINTPTFDVHKVQTAELMYKGNKYKAEKIKSSIFSRDYIVIFFPLLNVEREYRYYIKKE
ncbi:MAG: hypothetical protein ACOCRX_07535 [Candidatus Woesearchaeota archaeon]